MHGHHGWDGCGGGWDFGWFVPALIIGRLVSDAFGSRGPHSVTARTMYPHVPAPLAAQQPATVNANAAQACPGCGGAVEAGFRFCPHCGRKVAPPICRYCGTALKPEMRYCAQCGGPTR